MNLAISPAQQNSLSELFTLPLSWWCGSTLGQAIERVGNTSLEMGKGLVKSAQTLMKDGIRVWPPDEIHLRGAEVNYHTALEKLRFARTFLEFVGNGGLAREAQAQIRAVQLDRSPTSLSAIHERREESRRDYELVKNRSTYLSELFQANSREAVEKAFGFFKRLSIRDPATSFDYLLAALKIQAKRLVDGKSANSDEMSLFKSLVSSMEKILRGEETARHLVEVNDQKLGELALGPVGNRVAFAREDFEQLISSVLDSSKNPDPELARLVRAPFAGFVQGTERPRTPMDALFAYARVLAIPPADPKVHEFLRTVREDAVQNDRVRQLLESERLSAQVLLQGGKVEEAITTLARFFNLEGALRSVNDNWQQFPEMAREVRLAWLDLSEVLTRFYQFNGSEIARALQVRLRMRADDSNVIALSQALTATVVAMQKTLPGAWETPALNTLRHYIAAWVDQLVYNPKKSLQPIETVAEIYLPASSEETLKTFRRHIAGDIGRPLSPERPRVTVEVGRSLSLRDTESAVAEPLEKPIGRAFGYAGMGLYLLGKDLYRLIAHGESFSTNLFASAGSMALFAGLDWGAGRILKKMGFGGQVATLLGSVVMAGAAGLFFDPEFVENWRDREWGILGGIFCKHAASEGLAFMLGMQAGQFGTRLGLLKFMRPAGEDAASGISRLARTVLSGDRGQAFVGSIGGLLGGDLTSSLALAVL